MRIDGPVASAVAPDAVSQVAELLRDADRSIAGRERSGDRELGAEGVEAEMQHGGTHLGPDPAAVPVGRKPGAGTHRPQDGKVLRRQLLDADRRPVEEDGERESPAVDGPPPALQPEVPREP